MFKVFVGGISPEGEHLLTTYLNVFMPDAIIEPLKAVGIRSKLKNHAVRQDVALVILDDNLWQTCYGVAADVLSLPKVHRYIDDEGLNNFLISKFGRLDGVDTSESYVIPPDALMQNEEEDIEVPKSTNIFTTPSRETIPPDKIIEGSEGIVHTVTEDSYDNLSVAGEDLTVDEQVTERITELETRLAKSELLVRNLTLQLEDKNSDDDVQAFIGRIRELEAQLKDAKEQLEASGEDSYVQLGKVARAEQVIGEFDKLKNDLRIAKEEKSQLEYDKDNLTSQVELLHIKVDELKNRVAEVELLKEQLANKEEEIKESLGVVQAKDVEIGTLREEVESKDSEVSNLRLDLENKESEVSSLKLNIKGLREEIALKVNDLESKSVEISDLGSQVSELQSSLEDCQKEINTAIEEKQAIENKVVELQVSLEDCQKELNTALEGSTVELNDYKEKVESLGVEITALQEQVDSKDAEIAKLSEEYNTVVSSSEIQSGVVDKLVKEKEELEDKLVGIETKRLELEGKVATIQAQLDKANSDIIAKDTDILTLKAKRDEMSSQVEQLQQDIITSRADTETITRLESDLLEERKKSAKLASEVEVYRKTDDTGKTSELRLEIVRLKNELENAKVASTNVEELDICKKELQESREHCAMLELDMVEKDDIIKELESGVFGRLAGVAFSKAAFDVSLPNLVNIPENFYCTACGSNESNLSLYQLLKKSCTQDSKKRVLILDLATDSHIDREFGIQKATSPVAWLEGSDSFKNYVAQTRYPNVRVLTTALSYLNDLSLLNVNWQRCLNDLGAFKADVVIVNVGCLNNVVTKILFNMFSKAMTSHVVVKATPINLRAVILNMTGYREVSHFVTVSCVGFDEKASRNMYQRLVAKYKAQILGDSDVLKL